MEHQMTLKLITIFYLLVGASAAAAFRLSVSEPFQLTQISNITTLDNDLKNNFLVGLANGQARRYSSDFSSFTSLTVPEPVDRFSSWSIQLSSISLSNGTTWTMLSNMTLTLSHGFTTLRAYRYPTFTEMDSVSFNEAILDYRGLPLACGSNTYPFHIVVLNQTIKVAYKGILNTAFDLVPTFGSGTYCTAVSFSHWSLAYGGDFINITYTYYQSIKSGSGLSLIKPAITLTFRYVFSSQSYDLTIGSSIISLGSLSYYVTSMMMANGVLLMQEQGGGLLLHYGTVTGVTPYYDPSISANPILNFFINGGTYYILFSGGLVSASIYLSIAKIISSSLVSSLPTGSYRLTFGSLLNVLSQANTPIIYKGTCTGQSGFDFAGNCVSYNCAVPNCKECKLTVSTCGLCDIGFTRGEDLRCSVGSTYANTTSSANSTPSSGSTSTTNATSAGNTTAPTYNSTASANSTAFTNTTVPNNSTNASSITNFTAGETSRFYLLFPILQNFPFFEDLLWFLINATKSLISIPSARKIAPIFYYFGNFDDLYLYMYHDRLYGPTMKELFIHINAIQAAKWAVVDMGFNDAGIGNASVINEADFEGEYLTYDYSFPGRESEGSEGLLENCGNFIIFGIPLTFAAFLLLRCCFKALFQRPCSRLLRKFDFWGYFIVLIFEGNVQQFAFYLAAEWYHAATFAPWQRGIKTAVLLFGFVVVAAAVGGAFVLLSAYGRLNRHLADNNRNTLRGNAFLLLQSGVRNLILGMLHSALRPLPYATMLLLMLCAEAAFCVAFVTAVPLGTYRTLHCVWAFVWLSLVRMLLISTLFFDYSDVGNTLIETVQCALIVIMLLSYIIVTLIAILTSLFQIIHQFIQIIKGIPNILSPDYSQANVTTAITLNHVQVPTKNVVSFGRLKINRSLFKKQRKCKTVLCINQNSMKIIDLKQGKPKTKTIL